MLVGNCDILFLVSDTGPFKAIEFLENDISMASHSHKAMHHKSYQRIKALMQHESLIGVTSDIAFWDRRQQPSFEAVPCADSALLYAASKLDRQAVGLTVDKDGYGVRCN